MGIEGKVVGMEGILAGSGGRVTFGTVGIVGIVGFGRVALGNVGNVGFGSLQIPPCRRSRSAVVDVVIFVAVIAALAVLLFPYIQIFITESIRIIGVIMVIVKEEASVCPWIYVSIGFSVVTCFALAIWLVVDCTTRKCGNPNCQGLRNAPEFDIQLETEDSVRNSSSPSVAKDGGGAVKKGLFKLPCEHHRELESELKKMAPPNGRAVLVLMARCGCSVGRLEVPGPKKNWKIKKKDAAKDS